MSFFFFLFLFWIMRREDRGKIIENIAKAAIITAAYIAIEAII